jgi:hypothetical protein
VRRHGRLDLCENADQEAPSGAQQRPGDGTGPVAVRAADRGGRSACGWNTFQTPAVFWREPSPGGTKPSPGLWDGGFAGVIEAALGLGVHVLGQRASLRGGDILGEVFRI